MILPLLALLQTAPAQNPAAAPPDQKPVRVWLGTSGPLLRGEPVHVYVETAVDGYLVVLHRRTDGRIEVLFPGNPTDSPFVQGGTYEIRSAGDQASFVVAEPDGTGLILAALSPGAYRFDEFTRQASWNPDVLAPSWSGADAEGALSDIVQRMLGDGYFNYDVVAYTVAPRPYASAAQDTAPSSPDYPTCLGCTFVGFQEIVIAPPVGCDLVFGPCFPGRRFHRRDRAPESGIRSVELPMHVLALAVGPARPPLAAGTTRVARAPTIRDIRPRSRAPSAPAPAVERGVPVHAIPLVPGRTVAVRRRVPAAVSTRVYPAPQPIREARLTLSPTAPPAEPAPPAEALGPALESRGAVAAGLVPAPRRAAFATAMRLQPPGRAAASAAAGAGAATRPEPPGRAAASVAQAAPARSRGGEAHTLALPRAVWGGARRR